jgi:hypothetical protein
MLKPISGTTDPCLKLTPNQVDRNAALVLFQGQIVRHKSPEIQMSQLSVASPASSTVYMEPPKFGTAQNDFSGNKLKLSQGFQKIFRL